ncbi:MAG: hypothetical protein GY699_12610 [Desulfobacteraceae bacterium]|nr:hypothetical protein [Desulfobacteraceae bacterium]
MNCKDFQYWLLTRDVFTGNENLDVVKHLKGCKSCKKLYNIDLGLEENIQTAFVQQEIPNGLSHQIELTLDHAKIPKRVSKKRLTGSVFSVALASLIAFMMFFNTPFRYENLQQLSEKAVTRHLKRDMAMSFDANQIEQALIMLRKELKFNVIIPNLKNQGYALLGGRLCILDKCKIAYLFYEKQNKVTSLFIMDDNHLAFEMADGSRFINDIKGCHTDIWKEKGQIYAMVY